MTEEELDELCGGAPKHQQECLHCSYKTRKYYEAKLAREDIAEHELWRHGRSRQGGN